MSWQPPYPKPQPPPKEGTAWAVALSGLDDARCSLKAEHVHAILHQLGISPDCEWPPPPEVELYLRH